MFGGADSDSAQKRHYDQGKILFHGIGKSSLFKRNDSKPQIRLKPAGRRPGRCFSFIAFGGIPLKMEM
jgi:hypothetical protein